MALASAWTAGGPAPARADDLPWIELPPASALERAESSVALQRLPGDATLVPLKMAAVLILPLAGAQELELDYETSDLVTITWTNVNAGQYEPFGWLWRYRRLARGRGRLRMDLRIAANWAPTARPMLIVHGNGALTVTGLRVRRTADAAAAWAATDRAVRLAPESFGHVVINSFAPAWWRVSRGELLFEPVGWAFVALALGACLAAWAVRRRWRPALPLGAVVLAAVVAVDAFAAWKLAPPWRLAVHWDAEDRLRDGYPHSPELGALAALARATLPPDARVAVFGHSGDWFSPQTLCFHLAPRPCVVSRPGEPRAGISGVDQLADDQLDAIVTYNPEQPLPPGFTPVARTSAANLVARRR